MNDNDSTHSVQPRDNSANKECELIHHSCYEDTQRAAAMMTVSCVCVCVLSAVQSAAVRQHVRQSCGHVVCDCRLCGTVQANSTQTLMFIGPCIMLIVE